MFVAPLSWLFSKQSSESDKMSPQAAGCTMQTGRRFTGCVLSCCQQGAPRRGLAVASRDRRIEKAAHELIRQVDRVWPSRRVRSRDDCCPVPHQWEQAAGDTHDGSHNRVKRGAADPVRSAPMRRCLALTNTLPVPLSGDHLDSSHLPAQPNNHPSTLRRYSGGGRNAGDQPIVRLQRHRCRPAHSGSNQPECPVSCRAALSITFSDGLVRELDFATVLPGVLASIDDDESFAAVVVDPITGAFAWPNDIGPDPEVLHGDQESAAATQPPLLREYRPADARDQRNTRDRNRSGRLSLWSGSRPRWPVSPPVRECSCLLDMSVVLVACS